MTVNPPPGEPPAQPPGEQPPGSTQPWMDPNQIPPNAPPTPPYPPPAQAGPQGPSTQPWTGGQQWVSGPPSRGYAQPAGRQRAADIHPLDGAILLAGLLAFVFSFVRYYKVTITFPDGRQPVITADAWHGFFGWAAALLAVAGAVALAMAVFSPTVRSPAAGRTIVVVLFAVATLFVVIALAVVPADTSVLNGTGIKADKGHAWGYWASLVVIAVGFVLSLVRLAATGGRLPWSRSGSGPG